MSRSPPPRTSPPPESAVPPAAPGRRRLRFVQGAIFAVTAISLAGFYQLFGELKKLRHEATAAQTALRELQPTAAQFREDAEALVERGDLRGARQQLEFALAVAPADAALHCRMGDLHQSLLDFPAALAAYRQALTLDARLEAAADGAVLCERLARAGEEPGQLTSTTFYALHRVMLKHGRVAEAVRIAGRVPEDRELQRRTWQERLQRAGLNAVVALEREGRMRVQIRGAVQKAISVLRDLPVSHLDLAQTDLRDLSALAELPLESLDLTGTAVDELAPLAKMPLRVLKLSRTPVEEVGPLRGLPLRELDLSHTPVRSVGALREMPLRRLSLAHTRVVDLDPLASIPLLELDLSSTRITDLQPLSHLPLGVLRLDDTAVSDLTPLMRAPLAELSLNRTAITNLAPLARSPLEILRLAGCRNLTDLSPLAGCQELQYLSLPPQVIDRQPLAKLSRLRSVE